MHHENQCTKHPNRKDPADLAIGNDLTYSRIAPPKVNKNQSQPLSGKNFLKKMVPAIAPSHPFDTLLSGYPLLFSLQFLGKLQDHRAGNDSGLATIEQDRPVGWRLQTLVRKARIGQWDNQHRQVGFDPVSFSI
jgi:hypothetical protein